MFALHATGAGKSGVMINLRRMGLVVLGCALLAATALPPASAAKAIAAAQDHRL